MKRKLEKYTNLCQFLNPDHMFMTEIYSQTSGLESVERFHEPTRKLRELKQSTQENKTHTKFTYD
jgi:hypothetical protein